MPTIKRRVTIIPDDEALAVMGYDLNLDRTVITEAINGSCRAAARLIAQAGRELEGVISRAEWNAIADAMNGSAELYDYGRVHTPALQMITANLEDSLGIGKKWKFDVADLCRRLDALTPTHGEAILAAVRWFWQHCQAINHRTDEWWRSAFRLVSVDE